MSCRMEWLVLATLAAGKTTRDELISGRYEVVIACTAESAATPNHGQSDIHTIHNPGEIVMLRIVDGAIGQETLPRRSPCKLRVVADNLGAEISLERGLCYGRAHLDSSVRVVRGPREVEHGQLLVGQQEEAVRGDHRRRRVSRARTRHEWCVEVPVALLLQHRYRVKPCVTHQGTTPSEGMLVMKYVAIRRAVRR